MDVFVLVFLFSVVSGFSSHQAKLLLDFAELYNEQQTMTIFMCNISAIKPLFAGFLQTRICSDFCLIPNATRSHRELLIIDGLCANDILWSAAENNLLGSPHKWFLFLNNREDYRAVFDKIDILVDSDVTVATNIQSKEYILEKLFKMKPNTDLMIEPIDSWTVQTGLSKETELYSSKRRTNLNKTTIRICLVVTHNDTLHHLDDYRDKHIDTITKVNYILMQHMSDLLNARLSYTIESSWGYNRNGTWDGLIGELVHGISEIGGTPLFMTPDRLPFIEYIAMSTPTRSAFVFLQPKLSYVTNVYTLPFHWKVWVSTVFLIIVCIVGLLIVYRWDKKKKQYVPRKDRIGENYYAHDLVDISLLAFGALCQQGAAHLPRGVPSRIITILLFISLMFLYTSYSANIVALLQSSTSSIQTLSDLLRSRLNFGVDDTVFNRFYFPAATEPVRKAIYLQKISPSGQKPKYMPIEEGVRRLRKGLFAFHMETGVGYKIVGETFHEYEKCGLEEIPYLQVPDPWVAIQKNLPYKELLRVSSLKIQETGLRYREVSRLYTKKPTCPGRGGAFVSVGLIDCYPAAIVLLVGILTSFLLLCLEKTAHRRMNSLHFYEYHN